MRKKAIALLGIFTVGFLFSCGQVTTQRTYEGATVGAVGGAIAGALLDKENRWRGAVIGGAIGAVIGGTITEIAARASREAAMQNKPVEYTSVDGTQKVVAQPVASKGNCRIVKTTYYQNGKVVKVEEKEVCP